MKKVGYLGPPGTFSEEAAILHDPIAERVPSPSVHAVASAVEAGETDEGVVAIENSIEGSVNDTLDLLIHESELRITKELVLPITQCLMSGPGTRAADIQAIYSHPNALGQCRGFIERNFGHAQVIAAMSTVSAVEEMQRHTGRAAAIAPKRAAQLYGVEILDEGIQDHATNVTRFVVLSAEDHPLTGDDKTSICLSFADDRPGLLYGIVGAFAAKNINLAKVESRPSKESLGKYVFLIDVQGHRQDPDVAEALSIAAKQASVMKIFGSYPRFKPNF